MFSSVASVLTMTTRHKDSIINVSIFRVISFNAFLKLDPKFVMGYLGLNLGPRIDFWVLIFFWSRSPGDFLGFDCSAHSITPVT